jgi:hypothetical protein
MPSIQQSKQLQSSPSGDGGEQLQEEIKAITVHPPTEAFVKQLAELINDLIRHNFAKLVHILYCIDIDEKKLKLLLQENKHTDAGLLISNLIIQRQQQKLKTRQLFTQHTNIPEDEKW